MNRGLNQLNREVFYDDGKPDIRPWADEIAADYNCIVLTLKTMIVYQEPYNARQFAYMRKEARRMASDIERMAKHAGFSREDLDNERC